MDEYKILEIKESVFADNDREADALRASLKEMCIRDSSGIAQVCAGPARGLVTALKAVADEKDAA